MKDIRPQIAVILSTFGNFEIVKWVDCSSSGDPSTLSIKSQDTGERYTHYIGFTETAPMLNEIQSWMNRFTKGREEQAKLRQKSHTA